VYTHAHTHTTRALAYNTNNVNIRTAVVIRAPGHPRNPTEKHERRADSSPALAPNDFFFTHARTADVDRPHVRSYVTRALGGVHSSRRCKTLERPRVFRPNRIRVNRNVRFRYAVACSSYPYGCPGTPAAPPNTTTVYGRSRCPFRFRIVYVRL